MTAPETTAGRPTPAERAGGLPHRRFRAGSDSPPPRTRGGWPAGLLGMLVAVAAVEMTAARDGPKLMHDVAFGWRSGAESAARHARGCDALILGDSLAKHGLVPAVIERDTGLRAYNLAAAAAPTPLTAALLRRALDSGARPSAVVIEFKPSLLAGNPRLRTRFWPEVLSPAESFDLARLAGSGSFAAELALGHILPTFRRRHDLREAVAARLRGTPPRFGVVNAMAGRNWAVNRGANLARPRPGYDGRVSEAEHRELLSDAFRAHRANARALRGALRLASDRGARVYVLLPPFVPEVAARRAASGAAGKYEAFVRSLQAEVPGLTVLDAGPSGFPPGVFVDPIHLDRRGAAALSAAVAAVLRDDRDAPRPSASRWVSLPPFRPADEPAGLEDLEESRAQLDLPNVN